MGFERCQNHCEICTLEDTLSKNWYKHLKDEFNKPYFDKIYHALHTDVVIYPPIKKIFMFSRFFKIRETRVVILAQEPSCVENESNGLAYSSSKHITIPSTTANIYKEVFRSHAHILEKFDLKTLDNRDKQTFNRLYSCKIQTIQRNLELSYGIKLTGDLTEWAKQGVLLLNLNLTVIKDKRLSHSKLGWSLFTDRIIEIINKQCDNVVFLLWGNFAHKKVKYINENKHLILKSVIPAVYCFNQGFYGNDHFLLANEYLKKHGKGEIDWTNTRTFVN